MLGERVEKRLMGMYLLSYLTPTKHEISYVPVEF